MGKNRILIVEDDLDISEIITLNLQYSEYEYVALDDGMKTIEYLRKDHAFDLAILDIMLPGIDGFALMEYMRRYNIPVLYLTAKADVGSKIKGLRDGAEDYMVKPFDFRELIAVIHVMARKSGDNHSNIYKLADLTLDIAAKQVTRGGKVIDLTAKEYALLEFMMRNKGMVLSREQIENNLWNYKYEGGSNVVNVYIGYLRKKIDEGFDKKLIHTVWGIGWVLRED